MTQQSFFETTASPARRTKAGPVMGRRQAAALLGVSLDATAAELLRAFAERSRAGGNLREVEGAYDFLREGLDLT